MGLIAIIGGTGVCDPKILSNVHEDYMDTFYGTIHYWQEIGRASCRERV